MQSSWCRRGRSMAKSVRAKRQVPARNRTDDASATVATSAAVTADRGVGSIQFFTCQRSSPRADTSFQVADGITLG